MVDRTKTIIIASGYFNPLHVGHIHYLRVAKDLGDSLLVIVNNDKQVKLKKSIPFMSENERMEIVRALKYVDGVFPSIDIDKTVTRSISLLKQKIDLFESNTNEKYEVFFVNGGDRKDDNIPEEETCRQLGIKTVYGVGGNKEESSSNILSRVIKHE